MSRNQRHAWWVFAVCATAGAAMLLWLTLSVLSLERSEALARAEATQQSAVAAAMWRMDSWLAPKLSREARRPIAHYEAYAPQRVAYTKILGTIDPGEVLVPSPLLAFRDDLMILHFQIDRLGVVTSPQVPLASQRDLAEAAHPGLDIDAKANLLARVRGLVAAPGLAAQRRPGRHRDDAVPL